MEFLFTLLIVFGIIYLFLRLFGQQLLTWLMRRWVGRQFGATESGSARQQGGAWRRRQNPSQMSQRDPNEKLKMRDIAKKKFEKDQGEYVDFQEE